MTHESPEAGADVIRRADGTLAADVRHVSGLLDLNTRRLVAEPAQRWRERAARPDVLGLE